MAAAAPQKEYVNEAIKMHQEGRSIEEIAAAVKVPKPVIERLLGAYDMQLMVQTLARIDKRLTQVEQSMGSHAQAITNTLDTLKQWEGPMNRLREAISKEGGGQEPPQHRPPDPQQAGPGPGRYYAQNVPAGQPQGGDPEWDKAMQMMSLASRVLGGGGDSGGSKMEGMMMNMAMGMMGAQVENIKSQASLNGLLTKALAKRLGIEAEEVVAAAFD